MKTGNVWVHSPVVIIVTVLALDLAAVMNVADNPKGTRAKIAPLTMSALEILSAESMVFAEDPVLGLVTAATFLVIARREREIAMMTGDVTALWSVEVTIVMDQDSVAAMTAVKCQILQPLSLPHLCQPLWTLMNLQ